MLEEDVRTAEFCGLVERRASKSMRKEFTSVWVLAKELADMLVGMDPDRDLAIKWSQNIAQHKEELCALLNQLKNKP